MNPTTRSIRMKVAALGLVPLALTGGATAASALDQPTRTAAAPAAAPAPAPTAEVPSTWIIERLLTSPGSITLGDVERFATGGTTFSPTDLVAIVDTLTKPTGDPDPASKAYDAFLANMRRLDGDQLERIFSTLRGVSFADLERMYAEGSKLDQRQLTVLFTRLIHLTGAELESFLRTTSTLPADQLHAFLVYVTR